ncbi:serine/threonine-protein kinase [Amycolatopsis mediterranei]|uniref:WD40 repeat domain-containing serine/threonine protein kinase n=1 Tax=Amycolatopsis mediterranei TaxID=33910 RepID=UPI00342B563B
MPAQPLIQGDPRQVGEYRLRARIGAGGMGRVYLASSPSGRQVAVKLIRDELAGDLEFRHRFRHEVLAAQQVSGLFTAQVVDFDTDCAQPWLATAYLPGPSLQEAAVGSGLLPEAAVWLLTAGLAEALQDIHAAGLLHRDLKPSNVVLAADGPRVIDFGIARAAGATRLTRTGMQVGSPHFMAPEQLTGAELGPAADVFALGGLIVFAATGRAPFGDGPDAALLYRVNHEPPDLDGVPAGLSELAAACLDKEPRDRPAVEEILRRCRDIGGVGTEAVDSAWPPGGIAAEIGKRVTAAELPQPRVTVPADGKRRRWPLAVAAAVVVLAAAAVLIIPELSPFDRSAPARPATAPPAVAVLVGGEPEKGVAVSPDNHTVAAPGKNHTINLWNKTDQKIDIVLDGHSCDVQATAFSADGRAVVTGSCDHTVRLWPVSSPSPGSTTPAPSPVTSSANAPAPPIVRPIAVLALPDGESILTVSFDAQGHGVAVTRTKDGVTRLWDVASGQVVTTLDAPKDTGVATALFSQDGRVVAVSTGHGVLMFEAGSGRRLGEVGGQPHGVRAQAVSLDGRLLATSDDGDNLVRIWDVPGDRLLGTLPAELPGVQALAFSPDGHVLAAGRADGAVTLWDVTKRELLYTVSGHTGAVLSLKFSPDGKVLASGGVDQTVRLWDTSGLVAATSPTGTTSAVPAQLPNTTTYHDDFTLAAALDQIRAKGYDPIFMGVGGGPDAPEPPPMPGPLRAFAAAKICDCGNHPPVTIFFFAGQGLIGAFDAAQFDDWFIQSQDGQKVVVRHQDKLSTDPECCASGPVRDYTVTLFGGRLVADPPLPQDPNGGR